MGKKLTKGDAMWLVGMGITLITGLWVLWNANFSKTDIIMHIKLVYSLFLSLAIIVSAYYIVFKLEEKKNAKRK